MRIEISFERVGGSRGWTWSSFERSSTFGPDSVTLDFGTLSSPRQLLVCHQNLSSESPLWHQWEVPCWPQHSNALDRAEWVMCTIHFQQCQQALKLVSWCLKVRNFVLREVICWLDLCVVSILMNPFDYSMIFTQDDIDYFQYECSCSGNMDLFSAACTHTILWKSTYIHRRAFSVQ